MQLKREAIEKEDYSTAKNIKLSIEKIEKQIENQIGKRFLLGSTDSGFDSRS